MSANGQLGEVTLEELRKDYGDVTAVESIDLQMPPGEFFTMVGPSGCGKTTTLRMIAGFERPTSGRILLDGVDVAQTPPHKRNVNTVFQSYALFPHLSVADNVGFGLKYHKVSRDEKKRAVAETLELVQLAGFERRKPHELSGGQQQRVALARALVLRPRVLLLDEPLGALDARLRKDLQVELKALQEDVGVTFIFVTHDQEEALTMSDRIAVMNNGRVEQAGPPQAVYEDPETVFVADFLGASNLVTATAEGQDGDCCNLRVAERLITRAPGGDHVSRGREGDDPAGASGRRARRLGGRQPTSRPRGARRLPGQLPRAPRAHPGRKPDQGHRPERRDAARLRAGHRRYAPSPVRIAPCPRGHGRGRAAGATPAEEPEEKPETPAEPEEEKPDGN